jgi:NhaP-type Na+/H+ or K+/H+ antiporter
LLGGLLGATDPVAVIALLKDLGASKKLSTIIEGESLMNDGCVVLDPLALIFTNVYHSNELLNLLIILG